MKRFYAVWYNHLAQENQVEFFLAEDEETARRAMVLYMKLFAGDKYTEDDIEYISELSDNYFLTEQDVIGRYEALHKELPHI
jgi:hypothetical protein